MKIILYFAIFLIFAYGASSVTIGLNQFYADIYLTNGAYGAGAIFPCNVWFDGVSKQMRIDYKSPNGTVFMIVYYNYATQDKYQLCGTKCARATWTAPIPLFSGDSSLFSTVQTCQTPDYPGPRSCVSNCASYLTSPNQATGVYSLSFNSSGNANSLCLIRWSPGNQAPTTYGPEWHIQRIITSGYNTTTDPRASSNTGLYTNIFNGITCPKPTCFAELDVAIVIDESGSIYDAGAWPTVQSFVQDLVAALDIKPGGIRAGLTYFSGLNSCKQNWTYDSTVGAFVGKDGCSGSSKKGDNGNCDNCGGRWEQLTVGVITDKSALSNAVKSHTQAKGYTCISCGVDVGIKQLNFAPKANIQKVIILFTDGEQNRVDGDLKRQGKYAYDQNIKVIAIGTGNYKLSDLELFASENSIYTTANFDQLKDLITQIITPLCQPLPNIDTCNFCSGLCSCSVTCSCPTCNDGNECTSERCDPRPESDSGTAGVCLTTPKICDDSNICTVNKCNNATGCDYTTPTPLPNGAVQTFCKRYICSNPAGYEQIEMGNTLCPPASDKCIINYCNPSAGPTVVNGTSLTGGCTSINRTSSSYPYGTSITYTNSAGSTFTVPGCGRPAGTLNCQVFSCNSTDGLCIQNNLGCACLTDSDCNDGDGCTDDKCDTNLNKCTNTKFDCFAALSGNNCRQNQTTISATTATGDSYFGGATFALDSNGLPSPNNITRTCDELACYNGQRSTYTCKSINANSRVCERQVTPCQSSACSFTSCRSTGGWSTSQQVNTDCSKVTAKNCGDGNACTTDICTSTFVGYGCKNDNTCASSTGGSRCTNNPSVCDDNNICTSNNCIPATGCSYPTLPLPTTNFCFNTGCNAITGNFSNINTNACTVNANKCIINYCNTSSQSCQTVDRSTIPTTGSQSYVDADGSLKTVTGCQNTHACIVYGCDPATGQCTVDTSACGCLMNSTCDDGNGCTNEYCNTTSGRCVSLPNVDCYSEMSNGGCTTNQVYPLTTTTGQSNYDAGSPQTANFTWPSNYNCDQMSCFNGQRSSYTCSSTGNQTHTCLRSTLNCAKGGCVDTICRTLGSWSNGVMQTDCGNTFSPTCTSNGCFDISCNTSFVYGSGASRCISSAKAPCDDNDLCTVNQCNNATLPSGCDFNTKVSPPAPNDTCTNYVCSPTLGFQTIDVGATNCPTSSSNKCTIQYCNTTSKTCQTIDKNNIPAGTTVTYVDSAGISNTITGCGRPSTETLTCKDYSCDQNTGECGTSILRCKCLVDKDCQDGTGCTIDACDTRLNQCNRTVIDCFNILSNGSCPQNTNSAFDVLTGLNHYYKNISNAALNIYSTVDSNGLPSPSTGVSRTCAQLACYNGQPSQYVCSSVTEGSYTCQRTYQNCSRNGCQDNICRSFGNWTDGQMNSDCGSTFRPKCADNDACTSDYCNTAWLPTDNPNTRCLHDKIDAAVVCNDGNICTKDYCDNKDTTSDFCKHSLYDESYVKKNLCKNFTDCQTVRCSVNRCFYTDIECASPTLCVITLCNSTTKGKCKAFPGLYKFDKCNVCAGDGRSCLPVTPGTPKKTSIAVALGVGLGVGLFVAALLIGIFSKKSFDAYNALATETLGSVTNNPCHTGGDNHIDVSQYN